MSLIDIPWRISFFVSPTLETCFCDVFFSKQPEMLPGNKSKVQVSNENLAENFRDMVVKSSPEISRENRFRK